ncbi:MAG TPA: flagellar biosynthesis protein FlhB, partial [Lachnospiraceae bacterium]|nr:flagellar biosynthesis protein FlhB [Lachnospiraceae bacterium]
MVNYDLQRFAKDGPGGEKTEPATEKKLRDARTEGQVAKSHELANAVGLMILFLVLKIWAGSMGTKFLENFYYVYERIPEMVTLVNGKITPKLFASMLNQMILRMLFLLLPVFALGFTAAFGIDLMQVKWQPTTKPLAPKGSKLNPLKGFKRIFSKDKLVELLKSVIKLLLIGYMAVTTLKDEVTSLFLLYDMTLLSAIKLFGNVAINLGIKISAFYLILGFADYLYQKWKFSEDMKMTKQEVKDEWKNAEGDPKIKQKQRQRMMEAPRRRMMQAVPKADVVITNPTHFAVAVKYDPKVADAPYVLAKGEDFLAAKIKEEARKYHIDIVENKPLARMLYYNVELGAQIPP